MCTIAAGNSALLASENYALLFMSTVFEMVAVMVTFTTCIVCASVGVVLLGSAMVTLVPRKAIKRQSKRCTVSPHGKSIVATNGVHFAI